MYKSFYRLDRKPFEITPDTSFLWLGENHKEALSTLRYGILENKGFLLLTGGPGVGKTSIIKALTKSFDTDVEWGVIDDPSLERIDFYNEIARNFGIDKKFTSKVQFLIQFSHFLHKANDENKKVVLLIDECHLLSQEMLEEMRLLSNIEKADSKLINIFFVGENSFNEMLGQPKNRAVRQRITLTAEIPPLSVHETENYIRHRLNAGGAEGSIFSAKACQMVHRYSKGVPLQINKICDAALQLGANQGENTILPSLIESSFNKVNRKEEPKVITLNKDVISEQGWHDKDYSQFKLGDGPDSKITGFNLEVDRRSGWLKLGVAVLVLVVVGVYFFKSNQAPVPPEEPTAQVIERVEPSREVPKGSSSPAVAVLEKNGVEINKVKVEELRSAILEKAYEEEALAEEPKAALVVEGVAGVGVNPNNIVVEVPPEELRLEKAAFGEAQVVKDDQENVLEAVASAPTPTIETVTESLSVEKPEVQMEPLEPKKVVLPLQPNSLKLTRAARKNFNSFVKKMSNYPKATILVKGFVSSKSNSPENIKLSEARALSVYTMLLKKGVDAEQMEMEGMGNREPIASNNTRAGRAKNRRVEIDVVSDGLE